MTDAPMRKTGGRNELVADLLDSAQGWHHFGKDKLRDDSSAGAADLQSGADEVTVGHTTYVVDEGTDGGS
ncbi:hypothetical protein IPZ61_15700 [Streptomyces sioyaensis]|uniref:hypothetical protein n=1 Tax=Streptomyces sioyaensis TaxID=67364 RepID=UPI001F3FF410|nr:hypothetical protein [Streptomyces sioyaensis]MCF3174762.1 hypothetical protein [Streptomyces sioyaensis]